MQQEPMDDLFQMTTKKYEPKMEHGENDVALFSGKFQN